MNVETNLNQKQGICIPVNIEITKLDCAIEKAKELVALLREANELINSLSKGLELKTKFS